MRLLIADQQALFRDGLTLLVRDLGERIETLHFESYGEAMLSAIEAGRADLALIEVGLPGFPVPQGIRGLHERFPHLPIVMLAANERWSEACAAIEAGARGYIPKSASSAIMIAALRLILSGGTYLPPLVGHGAHRGGRMSAAAGGAGDSFGVDALTPRQREVLRCLARGHSNKEIAYQLGLSQGTVKIHVAAIFRAFKVRNRTQAVVAAGLQKA